MSALLGFFLPGTAFLLTVVLGLRVSRLGRPYHRLLFNVHKLLALGAVVAAVAQVVRSLNEFPATAPVVGLLVLAMLCAIALFATGALLSMGRLDYALMRTVHCIAPVVLVVAVGLVVYLLGRGA